ncbi:hypothetical protein TI39_contig4434g00001 [Zymoseptoria brevis]|uniref:JmjC domain-containing protein n=1 Tax=Zymoseptoria brevis TaxID=1047168 RepID=A0A0F4G7R6_9PEZI|nr:hypothetical protein TI39_contig4434g00001 [Zymoseptoria brevis]
MGSFAPGPGEERRDSVMAFVESDDIDSEIDTSASTVIARAYVVSDRGRQCGMRAGAAMEPDPEAPPGYHAQSASILYETTGDVGTSEEDTDQPAVYCNWIRRDAREQSWLPDQPAWPRCFAPSLATSTYIGTRVGGEEDADMLFLTQHELDAKLMASEKLDKPIVVHGHTFPDQHQHTAVSFARKLRACFNGEQVDVRRPNEEAPVKIDVNEFAERLTDDRGASDDSCNALNLVSIVHAAKPTFTQHSRFELLDVLVTRAKKLGPGKQMVIEAQFSDVESCLSFNICAERGSSSFAHVDALVGTWMRNLFGVKLWIVVPQNQMDEQDWERFAADGDRWDPQGKGRLVILREGDVFLMPPGLPVVHAVFTPEVCGMEGGMLWDNTNIINILKSMLWIHRNPKSTNEDFPRQLPSIMNALLEWLDAGPQYFDEDDLQIREAIRELSTQLGCRCTNKCGAECGCGGRCTEWCHGKKKKKTRVCMQ